MVVTLLRRRYGDVLKRVNVPAQWRDLQNTSRPHRPPNTVIMVTSGASSYDQ